MFKRMFPSLADRNCCGTSKDGAFRSRRWDGRTHGGKHQLRAPPQSARCEHAPVIEKVWLWVGTADTNVTVSKASGVTTDLAGISAVINSNLDDRGRPSPTLVVSNQATTPLLQHCRPRSAQSGSLHGRESRVGRDQHGHREAPMLPGTGWQVTPGRSTRPWAFRSGGARGSWRKRAHVSASLSGLIDELRPYARELDRAVHASGLPGFLHVDAAQPR